MATVTISMAVVPGAVARAAVASLLIFLMSVLPRARSRRPSLRKSANYSAAKRVDEQLLTEMQAHAALYLEGRPGNPFRGTIPLKPASQRA